MWCLVLRLSSVIHARRCSWSECSTAWVCLCNGFTSFHTGFTSLSIDFVFFFSSEIKVELCEFAPFSLWFYTKHQPILSIRSGHTWVMQLNDSPRIPGSIAEFELFSKLAPLCMFCVQRDACFLAACSFYFNGEHGKKGQRSCHTCGRWWWWQRYKENSWEQLGLIAGSYELCLILIQRSSCGIISLNSNVCLAFNCDLLYSLWAKVQTLSTLQVWAWSLLSNLCILEMLGHVGESFRGAANTTNADQDFKQTEFKKGVQRHFLLFDILDFQVMHKYKKSK